MRARFTMTGASLVVAATLAVALATHDGARAQATPAADDPPPKQSLDEPTATPANGDAIPLSLHNGVGQLWVPATRFRSGYAEHYDEHCSAALVTSDASAPSRLLLTAWHCIEDYRDLSRDLLFETRDGRQHPARVVASGGSMHGDWAILRLRSPLSGGLLLASPQQRASDLHAMAGFPRQPDADATLVHTRNCRVTGRDGRDLRSDCVLSKGASGGAVVDATDTRRYRGVISRGDATSVSIFVPLARFHSRLRLLLDAGAIPVQGS